MAMSTWGTDALANMIQACDFNKERMKLFGVDTENNLPSFDKIEATIVSPSQWATVVPIRGNVYCIGLRAIENVEAKQGMHSVMTP